MEIQDYEIACKVLIERWNDIQKSIEMVLEENREGNIGHSEIQHALYELQVKRNKIEDVYDYLAHFIQVMKAKEEYERG